MNNQVTSELTLIATAAIALASCSGTDGTDHSGYEEHEGHEHADEVEHEDQGSHGHGGEGSDLDRPVDELFAQKCEHAIKAFECDECRYEVGVVKAPASLFDGGLLATVQPERQAVSVPLKLTGEVQFDERRVAHVSSLIEGIIRKVHVALGDKVERGQSLIEIESVAIGEAQAAIAEEQAMLTLARRNHERIAALREEGIASEKELLEAKQELAAAEIRTVAARGKLKRLGMSGPGGRGKAGAGSAGYLLLRAPSDGTVLQMHAVVGEIAKPEESLVTVGDNAGLWVWADVYERDVAQIMNEQAKAKLSATVTVKAFPGEEFPGTVDFISPAMSESSRTVKLRISVANEDGRLLAGMFAGVNVLVPGDEQALTLPAGAVLEDAGRSFVFVHHDGDYFVRRPVVTGREYANLAEVTSGLTGDEVIVADGAFLMKSDVLRSKMGAGCAD